MLKSLENVNLIRHTMHIKDLLQLLRIHSKKYCQNCRFMFLTVIFFTVSLRIRFTSDFIYVLCVWFTHSFPYDFASFMKE